MSCPPPLKCTTVIQIHLLKSLGSSSLLLYKLATRVSPRPLARPVLCSTLNKYILLYSYVLYYSAGCARVTLPLSPLCVPGCRVKFNYLPPSPTFLHAFALLTIDSSVCCLLHTESYPPTCYPPLSVCWCVQ